MYAETIESNLSVIRSELVNRGLTYEHLQDDILDHICCMVEEGMESGQDFDSSYGEVLAHIEDNTLSNLQHQTLLLLDHKFQNMKKTMYFFGLAGSILTIIGAFFKMMHWPGASVMLSLGFLLVVAVFLPLYFIVSYREMSEKPSIIFPLVGYISLLFVFAGATFKIMHWPGANMILKASVAILLVGFLPLYIVQVFKKSSGQKINIAYVVMLLVGLSIVMVMSRVNISKDSIDSLTEETIRQQESIQLMEADIEAFLKSGGDSLVVGKLDKALVLAGNLEILADRMLDGLLATVKQSGVDIQHVKGRDFRNSGRDGFYDNGLAQEFKSKSRMLRDLLMEIVDDPVLDKQIEIDFEFAEDTWAIGWDPESYIYEPLIINYNKITNLKQKIVKAKYNVLMQY